MNYSIKINVDMSEKREQMKEINALDLFKFEAGEDSDIASKITKVDTSGISDVEFREGNEESEEEDSENSEEQESEKETIEEDIVESEEDVVEDVNSEESEELGVYSTMANHLIENGILTPKEDKEYIEGDEGLLELFKDSIEVGREEILNEYSSIELREGVTLKDLVAFKESGGDVREFLQRTVEAVDYRQVSVATDEEDLEYSVNTQKQVIRDRLVLDELSEEEIEETIAGFEKSETLEKQAEIALKNLIKRQDKEYTEMIKTQEQEKISRLENIKKQEEELKKTVYSLSKVGNFELTDPEKDKYYKYLTVPVKKDSNGNLLTQYQVDSLDINKRLELAYLQYKGGITGIEAKVEKKKNLKLQEKLSRFAQESKNNSRSTESFDDGDKPTSNKAGKLNIKFPEWM